MSIKVTNLSPENPSTDESAQIKAVQEKQFKDVAEIANASAQAIKGGQSDVALAVMKVNTIAMVLEKK